MQFKITNITLKTFTSNNKNYNNINYTIFIKNLNPVSYTHLTLQTNREV